MSSEEGLCVAEMRNAMDHPLVTTVSATMKGGRRTLLRAEAR